jgi:hypothetical protein
MKFGFELEFAAKRYNTRLSIRNDINKFTDRYNVGSDGTATASGYGQGIEIRTQREFDGIKFPYEEIKLLLDVIKTHKDEVRIGKECGIHFHFSGLGSIDRETFLDTIDTDYRRFYWGRRRTWCDYYIDRELEDVDVRRKYQPLRLVDGDHYECRIFNSTFNIRAFKNYYNKMVKAATAAANW